MVKLKDKLKRWRAFTRTTLDTTKKSEADQLQASARDSVGSAAQQSQTDAPTMSDGMGERSTISGGVQMRYLNLDSTAIHVGGQSLAGSERSARPGTVRSSQE